MRTNHNTHTAHLRRVAHIEAKFAKPIQEVLRDFVNTRELTCDEFLPQLGICHQTFVKWLKKYNVKGRGAKHRAYRRPEHCKNIGEALRGQKRSPAHQAAVTRSHLASGAWKPIGHTVVRKGYRYIKVCHGKSRSPSKGRPTSQNYKEEHRIIIEQMVRRQLMPCEHVHHLDGNGLNNHPDNLVVVSKEEHGWINRLLRCMDQPFAKAIIDTLQARFPRTSNFNAHFAALCWAQP